MNRELLFDFLNEKAEQYEEPSFISSDPLSIPHRYQKKEDIEIAGFLSATIAWGQRITIVKNAERLMQLMDDSPYEFVTSHSEKDLLRLSGFVHRTLNGDDAMALITALGKLYKEDGGLEQVFSGEGSMFEKIALFHRVMRMHLPLERSAKHISDPVSGSAAKRINMFLRWMVRSPKKGVDFGIWKAISSAELICPLDVHTATVGRKLGLLHRTQNDWLAAEELTASLREIDGNDPVKFDFALFGLGVNREI